MNIHRRFILPVLLFFSTFFFTQYTSQQILAQSTDTGWTIENFLSDITINPDTTVNVVETVTVNFNSLNKHGIYRHIPVKYQTGIGNQIHIRPKNLKVTNANNNTVPFQVSYPGNNLKLKIGDPNTTVSGIQTYIISYQISQVVTTPYARDSLNSNMAEFYWNVTGNEWPVPILNSQANISAPPDSTVDSICFTGFLGDDQTNCSHSHTSNFASFTASNLSPGQGLTIAVSLNQGPFTFPSTTTLIFWFIQSNWPYLLPLLTFIAMMNLYLKKGRDRQYKSLFHQQGDTTPVSIFEPVNALTVYSPPKDLSPGEVGTLIDERVHQSDITATIIDLARRHYLHIKDIPKKGIFSKADFELIWQNQSETGLKEYEKSVLDMLFTTTRKDTVRLSKLAPNAYQHLEKAQKHMYQHLTSSGYFAGNPQTVRRFYVAIGIAVAGIGSFTLAPWLSTFTSPLGSFIGVIGSGLVIIAFSFFMPARTPKGRQTLQEVVGLRDWIKVGAWRQQIHEKHNFFEEVLPFAIAFSLTHKFIKAFEKAKIKTPDWYQSSGSFNALYFTNSLNRLNTQVGSGIAATKPKSASSGGSGFSGGSSGGGFGGGGGGSW